MAQTPSPSPTRPLHRFAAWVAGITVLFAVVLGTQSWQAARADQVSRLTTAAQIGARAVDRYLAELDAGLQSLGQVVAPDGAPLSPAIASALLRQFQDTQPDLAGVTLLSPDGQLLAASLPPAPGGPGSAGAAFARALAAIPPGESSGVGRAVIGPTSHRWVFPIIHPVRGPDGRVTAALVAGIPVELLQSFWRDTPLMLHAATGLIRDDGYLVSRFPFDESDAPRLFGTPRTGTLRGELAARGAPLQGHVEGERGLDRVPSVFVYRRLEHFPLTLFIAQPRSEMLDAWWQRFRGTVLMLALVVLGGLVAFRATLRQQAAWAAERRRAERTLGETEARQRFVLDHMLAGVVVHDGPTGAIQWCNATAARLLGTDPRQPGGDGPSGRWTFVREDGTPMAPGDTPVGRVTRTGRPVVDLVAGVLQPAASEPVWLLVHAFPDHDPGGALRRVLVSFVDISPRRQAEHALAQRERTYRLLFDNSSDGVLHTRPTGRVLAANAAACAIFRMDEQALREVRRGVLLDPEAPEVRVLQRRLASEGRAHATLHMRRGDGSAFEADVSSTLYIDADGAPCCCVIVRDVTEQRHAEAALRAKALAEEANRAKSSFVARMSHELRTPLNAILGFAELLQHDPASPPNAVQQERLAHVRQAGEHLLQLINDVLDLSRIEAGALAIHLEDVDADACVHEIVRQLAPAAAAARVAVRVRPPETGDDRPRTVRGDAVRLRQVVLNLVSNAIKYNRPGGRVEVALAVREDGGVRLAVSDNGLGMTAPQLAALFQPFNRLGREASGIEGTGIGLVVTRSLVEMMHGTMAVRSDPGRGSEFSADFPAPADVALPEDGAGAAGLAPIVAVPGAGASFTAPGTAAAGASAPAGAGAAPAARADADAARHVLYVDDDEVNRALMQAFFQFRPDLSLSVANDGSEGLRLAAALRPRLALVDLMMPGLDGFDVLRALRADAVLAATPCVAVSANAMPAEIEEALAAGFDAYLTKPLSADTLMRTVDRFVPPAGPRAAEPAEAAPADGAPQEDAHVDEDEDDQAAERAR